VSQAMISNVQRPFPLGGRRCDVSAHDTLHAYG
jgi:hypothetical protein